VPAHLGIYVPQLALSYEELLTKAQDCERLGFRSMWLFDHLYGPELPEHPAFEGWTLATALLARTDRLRVGHLVLCNGFRHPALLGRMVSTLDVISGGRLELALGTGSYRREHEQAGLPWGTAAERSELLRESLEVLTRMLTPGPTTWTGRHFSVRDLPNLPLPAPRPRVMLGGIGPRYTLPLVAQYADAWNVPTYGVARRQEAAGLLEQECVRIGRDPGEISRSLQLVMAVAPDEAALPAVRALAERRYAGPAFALNDGGLIGTAPQVTERLRDYIAEGWTEFALFLHDRASRDTLELIAAEIAPHL
jgi:alkanesulfonate monooxygenase SsuD/methylene tetrahydromethanopterin reductase-like flavin-dependent oxidoreductase (luciferase family)